VSYSTNGLELATGFSVSRLNHRHKRSPHAHRDQLQRTALAYSFVSRPQRISTVCP
jgi:hypothetical protein